MNKTVEIEAEGETITKAEFERMFVFFGIEEILIQYNRDTDKIELLPADKDEE